MKVRYKCYHNKLKYIDTEVANHILKNVSKKRGESTLQLWKQACQRDESNTKKDFSCKGQWFVENWMIERIEPEKEETNNH